MKIVEHKILDEFSPAKVQFIRIDPEDISKTLLEILSVLMNLSWLNNFDQEFQRKAFISRANKTIDDIKEKFDKCVNDDISKDAGEYVVSELARETMVSKLKYLDVPLAELLGKKRSGNPGFDFHSQNEITDTVIFGAKDIEDLPELNTFCSRTSLERVSDGKKGFSAAFSAKNTSTEKIINNITKRGEFQSLLQYEELILVAVNL